MRSPKGNDVTDKLLVDLGQPVPPPPSPLAVDPRSVPCPYKGHRYASPCRALPGQPCRDGRGFAMKEHHAERRAAAGEVVLSYEDLFGEEAMPAEDPPEPEDGTEDADQAGGEP